MRHYYGTYKEAKKFVLWREILSIMMLISGLVFIRCGMYCCEKTSHIIFGTIFFIIGTPMAFLFFLPIFSSKCRDAMRKMR